MGSNAQVAEGGLNVENEFADLDNPTATRLGRDARLQQQQQQQQQRQTGGRSAMEMLGSPNEDGR